MSPGEVFKGGCLNLLWLEDAVATGLGFLKINFVSKIVWLKLH
jgi:hypothetical protein